MKILLWMGAVLVVVAAVLHLGAKNPKVPNEEYLLIIEESVPGEQQESTQELTLRLKTAGGVETLPLEEYLVSVVMSEMPASFSFEALKAQAVAARTFTARMLTSDKHTDADLCSNPSCCQAWKSEEELRKKYGSGFDAACEKAASAVQETAGQVLTYNGNLIEAVYYSCSGGASEPAVAVWGTEVPYLQSVPSPGEEIAAKYESQVRIPFAKFKSILRGEDADVWFSVIPEYWIGETVYSDGGGVATMSLGGVTFTGTKLRSLFSLNSTLFNLSVGNGEMIFSVKGYGHRVGMSQYGAEAMAQAGKTYGEILRHYYTGVTIKKLSRTGSGQLSFLET